MEVSELKQRLLLAADRLDQFAKEASASTATKTASLQKVAYAEKTAEIQSFDIGVIGERHDVSSNPLLDFILS